MFSIEFIGLPGSGKSLLRHRAVESFLGDGLECLTSEEAILEALGRKKDDWTTRLLLRFMSRKRALDKLHAILNRSLSRIGAESRFLEERGGVLQSLLNAEEFQGRSTGEKEVALARLMETAVFHQLISEEVAGSLPVFFDEGFAQRTMSLFLYPGVPPGRPHTGGPDAYLDSIPLPDLLVKVEVDNQVCYSRTVHRPEGPPIRMTGMDRESALSFLEDCRLMLERSAERLSGRGVPVIPVDNNHSPEEAARRLSRKLKASLS
jgi:hypothetical protein